MNESDLIPYTPTLKIPAQRVLVLAPHPDDEIFGCAGAIASHLKDGASVSVHVLTEGSLQGVKDVRLQESVDAGVVLGYGQPVFWSEPDRSLIACDRLVSRLANLLTDQQIDLLYAPSPWEVHPDHRQASWMAIEALRRTGGSCRIAFYEVGSALRPNVLLDITEYVELKQKAMACFKSQMHFQPYAEQVSALNKFRTYTLPAAVKSAEAFLLLTHAELASFSASYTDGMLSWSVKPSDGALEARPTLVSVLIRSMNQDKLFEALDSVALQTWPHIEVIVVSAVQEHRNLPQQCGSHILRFFNADKALSRSVAGNVALQEAQGEFLIFLDDDGWLMPGHVARLVDGLQFQPEVLAAHTGVAFVRNDGSAVGQNFYLSTDFSRKEDGHLTPIQAVMFRASALPKGLAFDESLDLQADWDFWRRLAQLSVLIQVPGVSAVYRVSDALDLIQKDSPPRDARRHLGDNNEFEVLRSELQQKQMLLSDSELLLSELSSRLEDLSGQLSNQTKQIEGIMSSRSWRLTQPLRSLAALFRR